MGFQKATFNQNFSAGHFTLDVYFTFMKRNKFLEAHRATKATAGIQVVQVCLIPGCFFIVPHSHKNDTSSLGLFD